MSYLEEQLINYQAESSIVVKEMSLCRNFPQNISQSSAKGSHNLCHCTMGKIEAVLCDSVLSDITSIQSKAQDGRRTLTVKLVILATTNSKEVQVAFSLQSHGILPAAQSHIRIHSERSIISQDKSEPRGDHLPVSRCIFGPLLWIDRAPLGCLGERGSQFRFVVFSQSIIKSLVYYISGGCGYKDTLYSSNIHIIGVTSLPAVFKSQQ